MCERNVALGGALFGYGNVDAGRDLYLGLRGGIRATPRTLVYAKGGYTNARLDLTTANSGRRNDEHFNLEGYRLGAGIEQALGTNSFAKLEYRYSNYSDARLEFDNGDNTDNFDVDTDRHQVMAGAGYRFWSRRIGVRNLDGKGRSRLLRPFFALEMADTINHGP